jgi:hypothetical protein
MEATPATAAVVSALRGVDIKQPARLTAALKPVPQQRNY